jgi:hypothetical protein
MSATLEMETLMTTLRGATDEQWLTFMKLYNERGVPLFFASVEPKKAAEMAEEADEKAAALKKAAAKMAFSSACSSSIIATYLSSRRLALLAQLAKMRSYLPVIDPKSPGLFPARISSLMTLRMWSFTPVFIALSTCVDTMCNCTS